MNFDMHAILNDVPLINVLDVGALSSPAEDAPYERLVDQKKARVIGFEPSECECELLNKDYGAPNKFYPFFIGDGNDAIYYETNSEMTGSLYRPNTKLLEKFQNMAELHMIEQLHTVKTRKLDDIDDVDNIDLFKMDVQGSELNVFKGATKALKSALVIQVEVEFLELYENQPMFSDIDNFLRKSGFQFHTFIGFGKRCFKPIILNDDINLGINQNLWSDAVYVKDWMFLENLSVEQLKKYAVIIHDIYKSSDLCYLILSQIDIIEKTNYASDYLQRLSGLG
jgi:FkbM family methyltransferase